jgi:hypothetical protein
MMITHKESSINFTPFDDAQSLPTIKTHRRERGGVEWKDKHTQKNILWAKKYSSLSCAIAITPANKKWTSNSRIINYEFFLASFLRSLQL